MRVLLLGGEGQLGKEIQDTVPPGATLWVRGHREVDVTDSAAVERALSETTPDVVFNAAAYTAVDQAEEEQDQAWSINAEAPRAIAEHVRESAGRLFHISTDFVFDGEKGSAYRPGDGTAPLGVYGRSKLAGEEAVLERLPERGLVVRAAWLFSAHGSNFVKTMLRLMNEREEVRVVCDQTGSPTWARGLAAALWRWVERPEARGLRHWADAGSASWYELAAATREIAVETGILSEPAELVAIPTSDYPTLARRPAMSVLDASQSWSELAVEPVHWQTSLQGMLRQYGRTHG